MHGSDEAWKTAAYFVTIVAGTVLLLIVFVVDWPTSWEEWGGGTQSPAEVLASIITPIGAVIAVGGLAWNIANSNRAARQSQKAELAGRFQKGVEMLGSTTTSTSVSGAYLLKSVATEAPNEYLVPTIESLAAFISDVDDETKSQFQQQDQATTVSFSELPLSDARAATALEIIAALHPRGEWPEESTHQGKFPIAQFYLAHRTFDNITLWNCSFVRCVMSNVTFTKCDFTGCFFDLIIGEAVKFEDCILTGAMFSLESGDGSPFNNPRRFEVINSTEDFVVNDSTYRAWKMQR